MDGALDYANAKDVQAPKGVDVIKMSLFRVVSGTWGSLCVFYIHGMPFVDFIFDVYFAYACHKSPQEGSLCSLTNVVLCA